MFLIFIIISMPVNGQADVNDFNTVLDPGVHAPRWDEKLAHFDILPELVVVAARPEENATKEIYMIMDTVVVSAKREMPATAYQKGGVHRGAEDLENLRYFFYAMATMIAILMIVIAFRLIPDSRATGLSAREPQAVRLYQPQKRKGRQ